MTLNLVEQEENGEQKAGKFTYLCRWERHLTGLPHLGVEDKWFALFVAL